MAENIIPTNALKLINKADEAHEGAVNNSAIVVLQYNTAQRILDDRNVLNDARNARIQAETDYNTARTAFRISKKAAQKLIAKSAEVLKPFLGPSGEAWVPTGLDTSHPAGQYDVDEIPGILQGLNDYFVAHPGRETAGTTPPVTATNLTIVRQNFVDTRQVRNAKLTAFNAAKSAVGAAKTVMQKRLSDLLSELRQILGDLNPLWGQFGFYEPGAVSVPGKVTHLTGSRAGSSVFLDWDDAERVAWYHVFRQVDGGAVERINIQFTLSEAHLQDQPAGVLKFYVVAVNATGPGVQSNTLTL